MTVELNIYDGTTFVPLIGVIKTGGTALHSFRPRFPASVDVFSESPFGGGRQLVSHSEGNVSDVFEVSVVSDDQDETIELLREMLGMLEDALRYWTDEFQVGINSNPVWIGARGYRETNTRYAYIKYYQIPELGEAYGGTLENAIRLASLEKFTLLIEHGIWRDQIPGAVVGINATANKLKGAITFGNQIPASESYENFVSSKYVNANLTHVYIWDQSAGAFSANVINGPFPLTLFNLPVQVNDAVYCGSITAPQIAFDNVLFPLLQSGDGSVLLVAEYWNGAWTALGTGSNVGDAYQPRQGDPEYPLGNNLFVPAPDTWTRSTIYSFKRTTDWVTTAVNGSNGYWVRFRVTVVAAAPGVIPRVDAPISTVNWPWVDVAGSAIAGDLNLLTQIKLSPTRVYKNIVVPYGDLPARMIISTRKKSRGADFSAYLPCNSAVCPPGVVFAPLLAVATVQSPYMSVARVNPAGASAETLRGTWLITNPYSTQWFGKFRCFIRFKEVSGSVGYRIRANLTASGSSYSSGVQYSSDVPIYTTDHAPVAPDYYEGVLDVGIINIHPSFTKQPYEFVIELLSTTAAAADQWVYDLVLMPADESSVELISSPESLNWDFALQEPFVDFTYPKEEVISFAREGSTDFAVSYITARTFDGSWLTAGKDQRIYVLAWYLDSLLINGAAAWSSPAGLNYQFSFELNGVAQYKALRGDS